MWVQFVNIHVGHVQVNKDASHTCLTYTRCYFIFVSRTVAYVYMLVWDDLCTRYTGTLARVDWPLFYDLARDENDAKSVKPSRKRRNTHTRRRYLPVNVATVSVSNHFHTPSTASSVMPIHQCAATKRGRIVLYESRQCFRRKVFMKHYDIHNCNIPCLSLSWSLMNSFSLLSLTWIKWALCNLQ